MSEASQPSTTTDLDNQLHDAPTDWSELIHLHHRVRSYIGWSDQDLIRISNSRQQLLALVPSLVDDFYAELKRHDETNSVITGGDAQIERLKKTLQEWLGALFVGPYDDDYIRTRCRIGWRHVEIGLNQSFFIAALSRLRAQISIQLSRSWLGTASELGEVLSSIGRLLDFDLTIIDYAYRLEILVRADRSQRLATIGQMAGNIAHELRNPLNVIQTSIYFLLNAPEIKPEKALEHLQRIDRQVQSCNNVITAIVNFTRLGVPERRRLSINAVLDESVQSEEIPTHIDLEFDRETTFDILGDPTQLRMAFGNLIRNAIDAMPEPGKLQIALEQKEDRVVISVTDTGVGIDAHRLKQIMEPLFTTKRRGIGLGLAIAKTVFDRHDATISVTSHLGQGTRFEVSLPISAAD